MRDRDGHRNRRTCSAPAERAARDPRQGRLERHADRPSPALRLPRRRQPLGGRRRHPEQRWHARPRAQAERPGPGRRAVPPRARWSAVCGRDAGGPVMRLGRVNRDQQHVERRAPGHSVTPTSSRTPGTSLGSCDAVTARVTDRDAAPLADHLVNVDEASIRIRNGSVIPPMDVPQAPRPELPTRRTDAPPTDARPTTASTAAEATPACRSSTPAPHPTQDPGDRARRRHRLSA